MFQQDALEHLYASRVTPFVRRVIVRRMEWAEEGYLHRYLTLEAVTAERIAFVVAAYKAIGDDTARCESIAAAMSPRDGRYEDRWHYFYEKAVTQAKEVLEWANEIQSNGENRRQRAWLRSGQATMADIRRVLRGADRSQRPGSRPARTSPTS